MTALARHLIVVTLVFFSTGAFAQTAAEKGLSIATAAAAAGEGFGDSTAKGEMILFSQSGRKSERRFTSETLEGLGRNPTANLLVFEWPGDVRNTALLTHGYDSKSDDQWLYLPSIGRVKRISSSARSGAFLGSEFSYEDMVDQGVEEFTHTWVRDEKCPDGRGNCHVLDRKPKRNSGYSLQRVWINTKELFAPQIQYFDRGSKHIKTLSASGHKKHLGRYWRASQLVMQNHLTGKRTVLSWSGQKFQNGLSMSNFNTRALKKSN